MIAEVWTTGADNNHGSYSNRQFDRIVQQALDAPDMATARARWVAAVNLLNGDVPAVWTTASPPNAGVHARFENMSVRSDNFVATLSQWYVPASKLIDRDRYTN